MALSGAMVKKSADQTTANYTTPTAIAWDAEVYDTDSIHDTVTNNTRLTVPSGWTYCIVNANVRLTSVSNSVTAGLHIAKGGTADFDGAAAQFASDDFTSKMQSVTTGPLPVSAGEYFEVFLTVQTDTSVTLESERSNFSIYKVA